MSLVDNTQVAELIRQKFDELAMLYGELVPFDKVYDEDLLECKYQQRDMIITDIIANKKESRDIERLNAFENLLETLESDIEMIVTTRMIEYSKWKTKYMSVCNRIQEVQERINILIKLERSINIKQ
jgi:hypothetical protein